MQKPSSAGGEELAAMGPQECPNLTESFHWDWRRRLFRFCTVFGNGKIEMHGRARFQRSTVTGAIRTSVINQGRLDIHFDDTLQLGPLGNVGHPLGLPVCPALQDERANREILL